MSPATSTACVVHLDSLLAVEALTGNAQFNLVTLSALEAVLEALVLYDKLVVYEHSQGRLLIELAAAEDKLYGYDAPEDQPLPFLYRLYKEDCLDWGNALNPETIRSESPTLLHPSSYWATSGKLITPISAGLPDELRAQGRTAPLEKIEPVVRESLRLIQWVGLPERLLPDQRTLFLQDYAATQMFELDSARSLAESKTADALLITPPAQPFYGAEQEALRSALHKKFLQAQEGLAKLVQEDAVNFDHTPLLAVALDTTLERKMLVQTIFQMRKDYAELRTIGRNYKVQLQGADTYQHRADAVREWNRDWDLALSRLGKRQKGLLGQIFSWDVIKKGTVRGALLESADKVFHSVGDLQVAANLRIVHRFAEEFAFARPIEKRVEELFGGLDKSDWSPWRVLTFF